MTCLAVFQYGLDHGTLKQHVQLVELAAVLTAPGRAFLEVLHEKNKKGRTFQRCRLAKRYRSASPRTPLFAPKEGSKSLGMWKI